MEPDLLCDRCGNKARYIQRYSGRKFCGRCFVRSLRKRVLREIRRQCLIEDGDSIIFAVSGGKDSLVCLDIVHGIEVGRNVEMAVLTVDEGIEGYRPGGVKAAQRAARGRDLELNLVSFKEEFGVDLDSIIHRGSPKRACTYCGVLRRWLLNKAARNLGATKLVTGHNLDDEAQSALLNMIRGDPARLARSGPEYLLTHPKLVPRAKPLRRIPERETLLYDLFRELDACLDSCPYSHFDMRNEVRTFLNAVEEKRPTSKNSFLSTIDRVARVMSGTYSGMKLIECRSCGEPTIGERCKACQLLDSLGLL